MNGWRAAAVVFAGLWSIAARADLPLPPVHQDVDGNGVDVVSGMFVYNVPDLSIGPSGPHGLSYVRMLSGYGWGNYLANGIFGNTSDLSVASLGHSNTFHNNNGSWTNQQGDGATLNCPSGTYSCSYTTADGSVTAFINVNVTNYPALATATTTTFSDGNVWKYNYEGASYCDQPFPYGGCLHTAYGNRLRSITNSFGYQLRFTYVGSTFNGSDDAAWSRIASVTTINGAMDPCDPNAPTCSYTQTWPSVGYTYSGTLLTDVLDPLGHSWHYDYDSSGRLNGIRRAGASSDDVTITYNSNLQVASVTRNGVLTTYAYTNWSDNTGTYQKMAINDPANHTRYVTSDQVKQMVITDQDPVGNTTSYTVDALSRITGVVYPEGNGATWQIDSNGNVLNVTRIPKPNSGLSSTTTSAVYPCASAATCNKPQSSTDANNNTTNYAFDPNTGLPTTLTLPAPTSGAIRPQIRYGYTTVSSSYGGVNSTITLPWTTSTCRTTTACAGTSDERKTVVSYYDATKNFLPQSVTTAAGDNSTSSAVSATYDSQGNPATITDPRNNKTNLQFNAARQLTLVVGPDPDGPDPLHNRYTLYHYALDSQLDSVTKGTSNSDGSSQSPLQQVSVQPDSYGRPVKQTLQDGSGTIYTFAQASYDALGRSDCRAVRMNGSNNFSAAGTNGACAMSPNTKLDRISRIEYDADSRPTRVWRSYATSAPLGEQKTYTPNGKVQSVTDGNGNLTTYKYDGFDRLIETHYPNPSGGGSSPNDITVLNYDYNDNVTRRSMRKNGQNTSYMIDGLNRVTNIYPPAISSAEFPLTFRYDNFGNTIQASDTNGRNLVFLYNALSQLTQETNPWGHFDYQYDPAGNRTYIGYGDGYWVNYSYDAVNEMKQVVEESATAGAGVLATIGYDNLGRRIWMNRGNGTSSSWVYGSNGAGLWLNRLIHYVNGGAGTVQYDYQYNPAGQIVQRSSTNENYEWTGGVAVNRAYTVNGLNQFTASGTVTPTYDDQGNLTSAGSGTYAYSSRNLLVTSGSNGYNYDPLGRMDADTAARLYFTYAGSGLMLEKDGSQSSAPTLRRYVYGYGGEPLVWYEGSGTGDRRWLAEDERGSVTAVLDGNGVATANQYDEYGIPQSTNVGRFGYTGQAWIPSLGMYNYKARMYSPTLGRFLQTDPIGYGDGLNWYNYTHGDPVNSVDSTGSTAFPTMPPPPPDPEIVVTGNRQPAPQLPSDDDITTVTDLGGLVHEYNPNPTAEPGVFDRCHTAYFEVTCSKNFKDPQDKKLTDCVPNGRTLVCGSNAKQTIKSQNCLGAAGANNAASLALDVAGGALALAAPEAKAAAGAVGVGGVTVGGLANDLIGLGIGTSNLISLGLDGQGSKVVNTIVKGLGYITGAGAIINDVRNIGADYNKCMKE